MLINEMSAEQITARKKELEAKRRDLLDANDELFWIDMELQAINKRIWEVAFS